MASSSLDTLYFAWATTPNEITLAELLNGVRRTAIKAFWRFRDREADLAQDVTLLVWQRLSAFVPDGAPHAFARWIATIVRRTRLDAFKDAVHISSTGFTEQALDDHVFIDIADLPDDMREVAVNLLHGYSLKETAVRMNLKPATLTKKLHRFRNSLPRSRRANP